MSIIRWPAEWEPHAGTWLAWPRNPHTWPGLFERIPEVYAELVRTIARFEPVRLLAGGEIRAVAERLVGGEANVELIDLETNDSWIRDFGPTFVLREDAGRMSLLGIDWRYNAWGGKYPPWNLDDQAAERIVARTPAELVRESRVLEGGAIEGNGQGTIVTTARCLLDPKRNAGITRADMEQLLATRLGARRVLWLEHGALAGDDTDGHIDQLVRFIDPETLVVATSEDEQDENYTPLRRLLAEVRALRDARGQPYRVVPLPIPRAAYHEEHRLPASYCNFAFVNGGLIVPVFAEPEDEQALGTFESLLPGRRIEPVRCRELAWGLGTVHCLTQQECRCAR